MSSWAAGRWGVEGSGGQAPLTADRRLSMRVSHTSCPPSSFVAQSGPPKPSAQMHTPRLWGDKRQLKGNVPHQPHTLAGPASLPGYKSLPHSVHGSSLGTEPCGSVGQPSPGDSGTVQHPQRRPGARTPEGQGSSQGPPIHSGQSPLRH